MSVLRSLAAILIVLAAGAFTAAPAHAGVLDVTCVPPSSDLVTYNPPLTATAQPTTVETTTLYDPCVSLSVPALTTGIRENTVMRSASCADLLSAGTTVFTIKWNTGQTSTITANRTSTVTAGALVVTFTGQVSSGLFAGDTVVQTVTGAAAPILLCLAGLGTVSSVYSVVTLEVTSV